MNGSVKLFLGAYINSTNAQNLNCLALAKYLDKSQFDITTLSLYSESSVSISNIRIYKCIWPHRIFVYWAYFSNIIKADVVYLPKGELLGFNSFICRLFRKKCLTTIEGIFDESGYKNAISTSGSNFLKYYHRFTKRYSITSFMKQYNYDKHSLRTEDKTLYLGTNSSHFHNSKKLENPLQKVIMIGNDLLRKGVLDFFQLAKCYPNLEFHLVGSGNGKIDVNSELERLGLSNVIYHGLLNQSKLKDLLLEIQLHIFPSRSEGFPKVILETACAGVPSLLYSDYGASEWINDNQNGFVVDTFDEMKHVVNGLLNDNKLLYQASLNAIRLGLSYDWKIKIKDWEDVFLALANDK